LSWEGYLKKEVYHVCTLRPHGESIYAHGKEIAIAVKQNGPNPDSNPRLRTAMQNAKGVNMPKDRVEAAIKRASSRDERI